MQIVDYYKRHRKFFVTLSQILIFPVALIVLDILIRTILNLGVYLGSFLRGLFELVL